MAVSKNFLAVVGLTIVVTSLLALHPLAPQSGNRTIETAIEHASTAHRHH